MKNLLIDYITFDITPQMIAESMEKNNGRLIVTGVLQRAEAKNQNGRVYPRPILEREVEKYITDSVKQRRALGELDHPDSSIINLNNVSHNVIDMDWKGNDLVGRVEELDEAKKKKEEEDVETTDVEATEEVPAEETPAEETPDVSGGLEDVAADMKGTEGDLMNHLMSALKISKGMNNEKLETQIGNTLKFFVSQYIGGGEQ